MKSPPPTPRTPPHQKTQRVAQRAVQRAVQQARALLLALALSLLLTPPPPALASETLPELGDSATRALTPAQEKQIGSQYFRSLLRNIHFIDDPELNAYLAQLGITIAKHANLRDITIKVHLLKDDTLNAFAVPDGYITFHTGLILATEEESELASVMGHEIAHISQRHLPRMLAKAEANRLPAIAAILASVLVGGQAGLAGISLANASLISQQLANNREFEKEADSIGIKLLADAGFDPSATARFFTKLDRYGDLHETPEYLRTHPLSFNRITEAENRASLYPPRAYTDPRAYYLFKAKIRANYSSRASSVLAYFADQTQASANNTPMERIAARYGLALTHLRLREFDRAKQVLSQLINQFPAEPAFQIAQAQVETAAGDPAAAAARLTDLVQARPDLRYLTHYQVDALLKADDAPTAKRVLRHRLRRNKDMYTLYPLLSKTNAKLGLHAESHQATAEYQAALGEYRPAITSLKLALRASQPDTYLHQSITARLTELEETAGNAPRPQF